MGEEIKAEDIKEILFYLDPLIRSSGAQANAETLMRSLQETDGGWGQYRLASVLRTRLKEAMMDVIRQEVRGVLGEEALSAESMQDLAPGLLQKIMEGDRWRELVIRLRQEVASCSSEVADSIRREGGDLDKIALKSPMQPQHSGPEGLGSTWNQANFIFMQPEQLRLLSGQIGGCEAKEVRVQALNTLLLSQVADVVASEQWPGIKLGFRRCLSDPDPSVSYLALKFHSRLATSGSHFAVKEGFVNLLTTLTSWYTDRKIVSALSSSVLSAEQSIHMAYLNILSLIVKIAKSLPKSWIRFPQRYVEEMIETMLELLFVQSNGHYSPMDMISMVDYEATWLRDWLHGKIARTIFIKNVKRSSSFITNLVNSVSNYPKSFQNMEGEIKSLKMSNFTQMSRSVIEYVSLLHKISFLGRLFSFQQGRTSDFRHYETATIKLALDSSTSEITGTIITKNINHIDAENINLVIEILNQNTLEASMIRNALEMCSLADISDVDHEVILPVLFNVLMRFPGDNKILKNTMKVFQKLATHTKAHVSSNWKKLIYQLPQDQTTPLLQCSPSLFLQKDTNLKHLTNITHISVASKSMAMSAILLKYDMWQKKENSLRVMLGMNDEKTMPFPNSIYATESEELMQEMLMSLSSFPFIVELSKTDQILNILDVESEENDVEWTLCKLRMIVSACSNLDSLVYLEEKFHLSEIIFKSMGKFKIEDEYTVDEESLYLQHIYNMTQELSIPTEKRKLVLSEPKNLHDSFEKKQIRKVKSSKLLDFINDKDRVADLGWLDTAGTLLKDLLVTNSTYLESRDIKIILNKFVKIHNKGPMESNSVILTNFTRVASNLVLNYGQRIGCLKHGTGENELKETLRSAQTFDPTLGSYDWFAASLFLMTGGDKELTGDVLQSMDGLVFSPYIWHSHGASKFGETFHLRTLAIAIEVVLKEELPALFSFFRMNKVPVCNVLDLWLRQCFQNFLDFKEIEHFILFTLLYGADYIIYFCISVFSHIQNNLLDQDETFINIYQRILSQQILGFNSGDYLPFMDKLSLKYKSMLIKFLTNSINQS